MSVQRVAMLSVHTSPLAQPGAGDGGGMNVYVRSLASNLARAGVACDVLTRADHAEQPPVAEVEPGFRVVHLAAGPIAPVPKSALPELVDPFVDAALDFLAAEHEPPDVLHANYWISGAVGHKLKHELDLPLVATFHTLDRVKAEAGVGDIDVTSWYGLLAPRPTPQPVLDAIFTVTAEVLKSTALQEKLDAQGLAVKIEAPDVFAERIRRDCPDLAPDAFISLAELAKFRTLYVEELLLAENGELTELDRQVAESIATHETLAENTDEEFEEQWTLAERLSDHLASFGGSWTFIILFGVVLVLFVELGQISPPIGINLFVIQSIWDGKLSEVILGTIPFHLTMFVVLALVILWPDLAMWLPQHMSR